MKLKKYNLIAVAIIAISACSIATYAQDAPAPTAKPSKSATTATSQSPAVSAQGFGSSYSTPAPYAAYNGSYGYAGLSYVQDSAYTRRMKNLQEKMNDLRKEMNDLRSDQVKKSNSIMRERMAVRTREMGRRSDSSFTRAFSRNAFGGVGRFSYGNEDERLQKSIASGEVKEKTKNFTKSYTIDKNDQLQIDNSYGNITVTTWDKNEFKVDVVIKAYTLDEAETQKLLDGTTIANSKEGDMVKFKTTLDQNWHNWGTSTNNGKITMMRKIIVNYTVYMPVKNALNIKNNYGATLLPNLDGKITINNSYGSFTAKNLSNADNVIHLQYIDANIASLSGNNIKIAYGTLKLDAADKLTLSMQYTPAKIGKLSTSGNIILTYGDGLQIADLDKNLKSLSVNSTYAPVRLNVTPATNADFDVTVGYTNFVYGDNAVSVTSKSPEDDRSWSSTKTYKGHIGKGSADKTISIKATYGSGVKFE